jgi:hypothetical protein
MPDENSFLEEYLGAKRAEASPTLPTMSQLEGGKELGLLGQVAGMGGTLLGTHLLSKLLPAPYRIPALLLSTLAGGTWGGIKSFLEDKPWYEYPGEMAKEAAYFTAPLPTMAAETSGELFKTLIGRKTPEEFAEELPGLGLGVGLGMLGLKGTNRGMLDPMIYKGLKKTLEEGRYQGLKGLIKETGENTWKELAPERASIYNYPIPRSLEKSLGASTFGEVFTPPIERMEPKVAKFDWNRGMVNQEMGKAFQIMGQKVKELNPDELKFATNYLKTGLQEGKNFWKDIPEETTEKIFGIFSPLKTLPENVKSKFLPEEEAYLLAKVNKRIGKLFEDEPVGDKFLTEIKSELSKVGNPEDVRGGMLKIIKNPAISDATKSYAVALHDLPVTSVEKLTRAWNQSTVDLFKQQVKTVPGSVISPEEFAKLPESSQVKFVRITKNELGNNWKEFNNQYLDRNIYHSMLDMNDAPGVSRSFLNKYYTQPWKIVKAVARFPAMFRNAFGNVWLNATTHNNPLPITRVDIYKGVLDDMGAAAPSKLGWLKVPGAGGSKPLAPDLAKFFHDAGYNPGAMPMHELPPWNQAMKASHNVVETMLNYFNYAVSPSTDLYTFLETWSKASKYRWNRMAGMEHWDAMTDAVRTTFHYGEVPRGVRLARETIMPFATFQSKVIPSTIENIVRNPWGVLKWYAIPWGITQGALKGLNISESEFEETRKNMPDYMRGGMYMVMPFRDEQGRLQLFNLTWWLPGLGDASEMLNNSGEPGRFMQNPAFNLGADIVRNKKGGTDIPVWNDWDAPVLKLGKMVGHMYQSIMPTWMPGFGRDSFPLLPAGPDFNLILEALEGRPEALTPTQAGAAQFGLRVTPLDESLLAQKRGRRLTRLKGEIEGQMRRELRRSVSDTERESIIQKYQGYLSNLQKVS